MKGGIVGGPTKKKQEVELDFPTDLPLVGDDLDRTDALD